MFEILNAKFKSNKIIRQEDIWGNIEEINLQLIKNLGAKNISVLSDKGNETRQFYIFPSCRTL